MKLFLILVVNLLLTPCLTMASPLQSELLSHRLTELLPREARWGVALIDIQSGKEIINAGNVNELLLPASLAKLFTAGATLEQEKEGKAVLLTTEILHDGHLTNGTLNGSIYLRGNGNCLLSADDLKKAAQTLRTKGIGSVTGGVVADDSRFDPRGLERTRKGTGYTPAGALGLDLHTVSVTVAPAEPEKSPMVSIEPPNAQARFAVAAKTGGGGKNSLSVTRLDDQSYTASGDIPNNSAPLRWRFPLDDPALYAAQSFSTILTEVGIKVSSDVSKGKTPVDSTRLTEISGPTMETFVAEMNTHSLNVAADNLLLALAASDSLPATRENGAQAISRHLERYGITAREVRIADGSGLLPGNRITPGAMARYLTSAAKQTWFPAFHQSLPRAGMDGTLRNGSFKNERFRAKSGSLENVVSLAGYGVDKGGREITFAFIANSPGPLPPNARNAGDIVMQFLYDEVLQ